MRRMMRHVSKVFAALLVLCMMCGMLVMPVMATDSTDSTDASSDTGVLSATSDPRESVMLISLGYEDDAGNFFDFKWGTCFLINDEYVLTNKHVVTMTSEEFDEFRSIFGVPDLAPNDSHIKLYLYVNRDMRVNAVMHDSVNSDDMDFAAVKLAEKIYDREPVALGDSDEVQTRDQVFAMGYPADSISNKEYNTKDDVSTVDGTISKVTATGGVDIIEHTAPLNLGNSGGPLLDENNNVVGINTFIAGRKNYSIQINAIKKGLDTFGIPYVTDPGPVDPPVEDNSALLAELQATVDEAKELAKDTKNYTEDSVNKLNDCIGAAETVLAKGEEAEKAEINQAMDDLNDAMLLEEKSGPNLILIGGIAAAVVILIIIIIVLVVSSSKKKKAKKAVAANTGANAGSSAGQISSTGTGSSDASMTAPASEGSSPTVLLSGGEGATELLGGNGAEAYLVRKKSGEKILINTQNFKLGKERKKVNYCVEDNTTVSRLHCEIVKKGADYYVVDLGSANYTYVNGVQVSAHKETILSDQSVLKLSNEEFEFHLS